MSTLFRYAGLALVALAAYFLGRSYEERENARVRALDGFVGLVRHIRTAVATYLEPIPRAVLSFADEELERIGLLPLLRDGGVLSEAYASVSGRLSLGADAQRLLSGLFERLGRGSRDETVRDMECTLEELSKIAERERAELEKNVRLAKTMLYAAALGIIILFL